jgi:hypothetical protein
MSLDQRIEDITKSIFRFLVELFPASVLLEGLRLYTNVSTTLGTAYKQLCKTRRAVKQSFESPVLAFFKYGSTYIPMPIHGNTNYSSLPDWVYTIDTNEFTIPNTEEIHMRAFHPPYISASLIHRYGSTETVLGDLSEWLGEQTVYAPDGIVPLQVLVSAWMYTNVPPTLLVHYKDLYLKTMNDSAEECIYSVETGEEVEEGEIVESVGASNAMTAAADAVAPSEA